MIEMIFVVAILSILVPMAAPSLGAWMERQRLHSAAESIHAGIQLTRVEAMARNTRVRFTLAADGTWQVACTGTTPGCPSTTALHERSGQESRGRFTISINGASSDGVSPGLTFDAQGRPDTGEASRIQQVDVTAPTAIDSTSASRASRIVVSDFGRTRLCYPYAATGSPTRC